jgi:methionyl-tRNA synthetase
MRSFGRVLALTLAMIVAAAVPQAGAPRPQTREEDSALAEMQQRAQRAASKQRYEQLKRDTDKLLQLATELKAYVDQTDENTLSVNVIRKAEEIEKLAKSVKTKMKGE